MKVQYHWQESKIFKIFSMITLVLKNDIERKKPKITVFGRISETPPCEVSLNWVVLNPTTTDSWSTDQPTTDY